jgi:phenylpropionate dioxygenase-like ring-hydroxylating dioxygenase large terminal subunit
MIPKENYHSRAIFEKEMQSLFNRGYQFAALTTELANDRDFVCLDYFGTSVVVQNFKGEIRAFQNVCAHRFNRIQTEERGNRALTCMYHGWTYDETGFPAGMPKRSQFVCPKGDNSALYLTRYDVAICGIFVFVARAPATGDLKTQLGSFYDVLSDISQHIGNETHYSNIPHKANWKLIVENVIECYHCPTVHQATFMHYGFGKAAMEDLVIDGSHSSCHFPREEAVNEDLMRRGLSHLNGRSLKHRSYHHIYVFPNLFVSSTQGTSFFVGQLLPVSEEETLLRIRYFEPKMEWKPWYRSRQDLVNVETVDVGLRLVAEDRQILENIQRGMRLSDRPGVLGEDEVRIAAFAKRYNELMASDGAAVETEVMDVAGGLPAAPAALADLQRA